MKFAAFDVEGRTGDEGIKGVSVYYEHGGFYYEDPETAISALRTLAEEGYTLIAHNAEYDISVLFWQLGEQVKIVYKNDRFNHGEWEYAPNKKRCHIWCTMILSGMGSIASIGPYLGLPKRDTPFSVTGEDINVYRWKCDTHSKWECIECYAIRDSEICYRYIEALVSFLRSYDVKPRRTLASCAVAVWRALDSPGDIRLPNPDYDRFARDGYFGGRVECFKLGHIAPVYTADVKSMYPSCMLDTPMPDPATTNLVQHEHRNLAILEYEGMSECTVFIPQMHVPPLPILKNGKLYFPIGYVRGRWTHLEIRQAIALGVDVTTIHSSLYSTKTVFPFTTYIETMLTLRETFKAEHDPREFVAKILANSLYGRLGMSHIQLTEEQLLMPLAALDEDLAGWTIYSDGRNPVIKKERADSVPSRERNVLWAAQITSAARVKWLQFALLQGENIAYGDTDSIFSTQPIVGLGEGVGQLESSGDYKEGWIVAPKMYALTPYDGQRIAKAKGVPKEKAWRYLKDGQASYMTVVRPRQSIRRHIPAGSWVQVTKHHMNAPGKRHILNPHYRESFDASSDTEPLVFSVEGDEDSGIEG